MQNSRRSERSGRLARRRMITPARPKTIALVPLLVLLMAKVLMVLQVMLLNDQSNFHQLVTNLALKYLANTKLQLVRRFNNFKTTLSHSTCNSSTLDIQPRLMVPQTCNNSTVSITIPLAGNLWWTC